MLREITPIRQNSDRVKKRWFSSSDMDLFVWFNDQVPARFQLSYDKPAREHAITWDIESGFSHNSVDTGEHSPGTKYKMTPILVANGEFDAASIARKFLQASQNIEESLADFIYARLLEYPGRLSIHSMRGSASKDL